MTNIIRTITMGVIAAFLVMIGMISPVQAHDLVTASEPKQGAIIDSLPDRLSINFSAQPKEGFNTIALSRGGEVLFSAEPQLDGQTLSVEVPKDISSEAGDYIVGYQITSSDGHATRGNYGFTISGTASSGESAESSAIASENTSETESDTATVEKEEATQAGEGLPAWLLPLGGIIVISGALVLAIQRWRNLD